MIPSVVAVFNELSLPTSILTDAEAAAIIEILSTTVLSLRDVRRDMVLNSPVVLGDQMIATGGRTFSAFALAAGGRTREQWRLIQLTLSKASFFRDPPQTAPDALLETYLCDGVHAIGLGRAARYDQVALSLTTAPSWEHCEVELERQWIEESTGDTIERKDAAKVLHASRPEHVDGLADHIREMSLPYGFSGVDLWAQRDVLFPGIGFLPRVENDLAVFASGAPALGQVRVRLRQLAQSARAWHHNGGATPQWQSRVTPEGVRRQQLSEFRDVDGVTRCFDLHARFTPGHGRIHMRLNQADIPPFITIAYVGAKLK
jgi:hypothetical protein